ncbi:MAG: hypothetical protein DRI95_11840, partial [Bacteroidetes bacterium]
GKKINVTVIATGFETDIIPELYAQRPVFKRDKKVEDFSLEENTISEEVDFEVNFTNDDLKEVSAKAQFFNQNETFNNEGFGLEKQEEEIIVHQQNPQEENTDDEDERVRKALERLAQMEQNKKKTEQKNQKVERNAKTIDELENIPAYKRRNVDLDQEADIEDSKVSRYVLNDDDDDIQLSENSFLHDNVD